jgi:hypothetical protein
MILKANCDVVAWTQTMLEEQLAEAIGGLIEFLIGNDLGRRSHDDCRLVWGGGCDLSRKHSQKLAHNLKRQAILDPKSTGPIQRKVSGVSRFAVN